MFCKFFVPEHYFNTSAVRQYNFWYKQLVFSASLR